VYAVAEDAAERGIDPGAFLAGVETLGRAAIPGLGTEFDGVWHR